MPDYYARVEAVDFDHAVYDSDDISTIRGGSSIARNAILELKSRFKNELEKITDNASIGLYKLKDGASAKAIRKDILAFLKDRSGGHVDFVADVLERNGMSFGEIRAKLIAANQWSRMRRMTVPMAGVWDGTKDPCEIDGIRPGKIRQSGESHSDSVDYRREHGRKLRQKFYSELLTEVSDLEFTDNLEELSGKGKIAFIYVDGNKFGKLRNFNGDDEKMLEAYEYAVQKEFREPILKTIVDDMRKYPSCRFENKKICLETLLWGGDEIELVVPAGKGLDILRQLYEFQPVRVPYEFEPPEISNKDKCVPLTQAAGVVFCKYNAPILHIRGLSRSLGEMAKKGISGPPKSADEGNRFHYMVLDSFDMLGGDPGTHIKNYYGPVDFSSLIMKGGELKSFIANMRILKAAYPRGKIYEIIDSLIKCGDRESVRKIWKRGLSKCGSGKESVNAAMEELVGDSVEKWFTIADLWDFA